MLPFGIPNINTMIITGVSLAKMPLIEVFKDIKMYQFTFLKMLVIPMIAAFAIRLFHLDPVLSGIMESGIAAFPKYCTKLTAGAGASI